MNKVIFPIVSLLGFLALLLLYLAGTGYVNGVFELGQAFTIMRYCAYAGITSVGLVIFYLLWQRPVGLKVLILFLSALAGLTAFYLPYRQQQIASQVPPIHDITTSIASPPQFVAIVPLRADAPNPPEYLGGETSELQRQFYPDIMSANLADGRVEATETTKWFGFKDDVVVRLTRGTADSTILDVRSKSRVGRSDIGVNAKRIRTFTSLLNARLGVEN